MHRIIYLVVLFSSFCLPIVKAQDSILHKEIVLEKNSGTVGELLHALSEKGGFSFAYSNDIDLVRKVQLKGTTQSVKAYLDEIFVQGEITYIFKENKIILAKARDEKERLNSSHKVTISGYVKDSTTGEVLIGASIFIKTSSVGTSSNAYGFYSLTVPEGTYTLTYSYIGYQSTVQTIHLSTNQKVDVSLWASSQELNEVVVSSASEETTTSGEMSTHQLNINTIRQMPALAGEADVLKSIQLLPGVHTVGEGSTGFFVRGGGSDQNLILLDEAPVYNPSHFLGFLSVFNPDAIKDVKLYKGGIPAEYGGRASSVLDIRMKEGNTKKLGISGGIGLLGGARLTVEAPIHQGKGSFILSGRRTFAEPLLWLAPLADTLFKGTKLYFYDFNAKLNYTVNEKNRIYISGYVGRDVNRIPLLDYTINWGNSTSTFRWNHLFSPKLFSTVTLLYSKYNYNLSTPAAEVPFNWQSHIEDIHLKTDFTLFATPSTSLKFGISSIFHRFAPGSNTDNPTFSVPATNALEQALYVSAEKNIGRVLQVEYGMRISLFGNIGKARVFHYNAQHLPEDTTDYAKGKVYHTYGGIEPRLNIRVNINDQNSIKLSYNRLNQYIQLLSNSSSSFTAFDVWYPSGPTIKPLRADQFAIGYFRHLSKNRIEASIEGYYKTIANQVDYRDHAQLTFNPFLEGELRTGKAWAYGVEFFLRKPAGKFTGWINYTWSRAMRQIPEINMGKAYPAIYDQPHKISLTATYAISDRLSLGMNWVYNTGGSINLPVESFSYEGQTVPIYSGRNASRLPDYHRLDISLTRKMKAKPGRKWEGWWVYSFYNVYARKNPFTLFVGEDLSGKADKFKPRIVANQAYLFSIIPTVSFNFKF